MVSIHSCPQFWHSKKNSNSTHFIELYSWILEQTKPLQPIGPAQSSSLSPSSSPCRSSGNHSRRLFQKSIEGFDCKINAKLLGPRSGTAWVGLTGEHKHRVFPSRLESLLAAATGSLEENVLPLLLY